MPVFLSYFPSGTSLKTVEHFSQLITSGGMFRMFDYGPQENLKLYNQADPPEYDVANIKLPVHLFVGMNDLVSPLEVEYFLKLILFNTCRRVKFCLGCKHS